MATFSLHLFDEADNAITSLISLVAPEGQFAGESYVFNNVINGVSRVEFEVLTLLTQGVCCRIEVREVAFTGTPTALPVGSSLPVVMMAVLLMAIRKRPALLGFARAANWFTGQREPWDRSRASL